MTFPEILMLILSAIALLFIGFVLIGAVKLYRFAILRSKKEETYEEGLPLERMRRKKKKKEYEDLVEEGISWMKAHKEKAQDVYVTSFDGLRLHGAYYRCDDARGAVVLCHGFHSLAEADFAPTVSYYASRGFSVMLIDERGHGKSEGKHICFGVKERYDLRIWLWETEKYCPGVPIFLSGISMGCASALYCAELSDLPGAFSGVIADCGYDSPYEEVKWFTKHVMNAPADLFIPVSNLFCRLFAGFSLKDSSVTKNAERISVPVLYIHGTVDKVVPYENAERICAALGGKARLLRIEDAPHGCAYLEAPDIWKREVDSFLDRCCQKQN